MSIRNFSLTVFSLCLLLPQNWANAQEGSPAGPVPPEVLELRRRGLSKALEGAPAILSSAGSRGAYAQDSDYRENNDFFYFTGLEAPGAWLLLNGGEGEDAVLYLPPRSAGAERWTGPQMGPGNEVRTVTGMAHIRSTADLEGDLKSWFGGGGDGGQAATDTLFTSFGNPGSEAILGSFLPTSTHLPISLSPYLASLRVVKDPEELRRLRRAVDITAEAHREIWRLAEAGATEYQLEAALEYVFKAQGAERVGFPSIVGSGPNSVVLHYDKNRRRVEEGDLVVVDIGAEFGYYTADLTRTFPVGGRFSSRQKSLYDLVLGAHNAGLEVMGPGGTMRQVNQAVRGFLETNSGDLCGEGSCAPFLIHGVSHWLGMDVHDVGANGSSFLPGMVLTLEPGLYLPQEALGIRIEDNVLVTESGYEVLSGDLPRSTEEIEAVMLEEPKWVRRKPVGLGY